MDVSSRDSSHSTSTDGSGPPPWPPWDLATSSMEESSMDGQELDPQEDLNLTVSSSKTASVNRPAWLSWTTSSMTDSHGMTPSMTFH